MHTPGSNGLTAAGASENTIERDQQRDIQGAEWREDYRELEGCMMLSSDSDGQPPPRKRSRRTSAGDEGGAAGKKARGRPRVNTQDATAADVSRFNYFQR